MKVYNEQSDNLLDEQLINKLQEIRKQRNFDAKKYIENKTNLLNEYMNKYGLKACVVAISGGIDSAIVLGLIKRASEKSDSPIKKIFPMLLPVLDSTGVTNQLSATEKGKELCEKLQVKSYIIDLSRINTEMRNSLEPVIDIKGEDWAIGQLAPYSRTPILYYTTSLLTQIGYGAIICGTTNRDEGAYLGYVGKASDGMVDIQLISDIHKSEVYQVANELKIPECIINAVPTGDMYDNRNDENVFGAPYDFVELYLNYLNFEKIEKEKFNNSLNPNAKEQFDFYSRNLENLHRYNLHKYISKSPAVHLDLFDSSVKGGWDNYCQIMNEWLKK